ncbi:MAG: hypothetical protein ACREID_07025, partial [Planctomycetota bacterium]
MAETENDIVVETAAGVVTLPRSSVVGIQRDTVAAAQEKQVTRREEWFLVLHRGAVVGWRSTVVTERGGSVRVEERTDFFRPEGGEDASVHRIEVAGRDGRPVEFFLRERYGAGEEIVVGDVEDGRARVRVRRAGTLETRALDLPEGWTLPLPAWAAFLDASAPGETRAIVALDPRRLVPTPMVLRRDADAAAPSSGDRRPCRALSLTSEASATRALYRPG